MTTYRVEQEIEREGFVNHILRGDPPEIPPRRHDDHGDGGDAGISELRLPELPTVHLRHHQIQQDHFWFRLLLLDVRERSGSVRHPERAVTALCQELANTLS
jgi:hypothetical protein